MTNNEVENFYDHEATKWGQQIDFPNSRTFKQYTHRIYNRYPARSISLVPRSIIRAHLPQPSSQPYIILDPFMGSGTTAVEATLAGAIVIGTEIDPFARLVSEVKTSPLTAEEIQECRMLFNKINKSFLKSSADSNLKPSLKNIDYWFTANNFNELLKLKTTIFDSLESKSNQKIFNFFKVVFADIIRPCSLAERQTLKPYISKKYAKTPSNVTDEFSKTFDTYIKCIQEYSEAVKENASNKLLWLGHNGTKFNVSEKLKANLAITSPPYINALDYVRCIKIESAWVGCANDSDFKNIKANQVGDSLRSKLYGSPDNDLGKLIKKYIDKIEKVDKNRAKVTHAYFEDMQRNLNCTYDALTKDAYYYLIVGNSTIRDIEVPTHEIIAKIAEPLGFKWDIYYKYRIKDHRTSIPRGDQGGKINFEHVIGLRK